MADAASPKDGFVPIKNRPPGDGDDRPAAAIVSPDALALVRFGLRAADDPRIVDTVKVIDALLRCDLPQGPVWYRYTGDGYGEHADGAPFDGTGIGRPWPLLTGERAHYELAAGRPDEAARLLATLEGCAGGGGLLPEQVWDGADMPQHELTRGGPTGSAMPLVWAHAEHIKLLRSLRDGAVFDMPPQGAKRYVEGKTPSTLRSWRFNNKVRSHAGRQGLAHRGAGAGHGPLEQRRLGDVLRTAIRPRTPSASIRSTCRPTGCRPPRRSSSLSAGSRTRVGRMSTFGSKSKAEPWPPAWAPGPAEPATGVAPCRSE